MKESGGLLVVLSWRRGARSLGQRVCVCVCVCVCVGVCVCFVPRVGLGHMMDGL